MTYAWGVTGNGAVYAWGTAIGPSPTPDDGTYVATLAATDR